jgi:CBS domain-containing protein
MPITKFVKQDIATLPYDASVEEAANMMRDENIGAVVVCDDDQRPIGMVTDRDIVLRCVCDGGDCSDTTVGDIMSRSIQTVHQNSGLMDIVKCMRDSGVRRVPIVDEGGKAVGLVSFGDVLEVLVTELSDLARPATPEEKKIDKYAA